MTVKIDWEYGEKIYLISDPDKEVHIITGFVLRPGKQLKLEASYMGDIYEVFEYEVSREKPVI